MPPNATGTWVLRVSVNTSATILSRSERITAYEEVTQKMKSPPIVNHSICSVRIQQRNLFST
jgi:hypothetical protein